MKNLFKHTIALLLLCSAASAAEESILFEYQDGASPRISLKTSDKTILEQVSTLLTGNFEEKSAVLDTICKNYIDNNLQAELDAPTTIQNLLFYITSETDVEPTSLLLNDDNQSDYMGYRVLDSQKKEITLDLIGLMPKDIVGENLFELETHLEEYPIASAHISALKKMLITDYVKGQDISSNYLEKLIEGTEYSDISETIQAIKSELFEPTKFKKFLAATQLIAVLHNMML